MGYFVKALELVDKQVAVFAVVEDDEVVQAVGVAVALRLQMKICLPLAVPCLT
jgi:hypothetical protein